MGAPSSWFFFRQSAMSATAGARKLLAGRCGYEKRSCLQKL